MNFIETLDLANMLNFRINDCHYVSVDLPGEHLPPTKLNEVVAWVNNKGMTHQKWADIEISRDDSELLVQLYGKGVAHSVVRLTTTHKTYHYALHVSEQQDGRMILRQLTVSVGGEGQYTLHAFRNTRGTGEAVIGINPSLGDFRPVIALIGRLDMGVVDWGRGSKDFIKLIQQMIVQYERGEKHRKLS